MSALDASVGARILAELERLKTSLRLAILSITHDLRLVRQLAERVVVMRRGEVVELAPTRELFRRPRHPYTRALLSASELRAEVASDDEEAEVKRPLVEVASGHWACV